MVTGGELAIVKPVVEALIKLFERSKSAKLKSTAESALSEAIRELLLAPNDLHSAEAKIAAAKAAGIINADLILAEQMLDKHKQAVHFAVGKAAVKPAAKKAAVKPAAKKAAVKPAAKKAVAKPAAKKAVAKPAAKKAVAK